jgi:glycosyltransferase involved in cell wall biosynthesis
MRLLFLAPAPPSPTGGGGSLRMFHILRFLAERFAVDLVAPALDGMDDAVRLLRGHCVDMEFVPPAPRGRMRRAPRLGPYKRDPALAVLVSRRLRSGAYGALHVEKPAMLPYVPAGTRTPIILDTFAYGLTGALRALRSEAGLLTRARNLVRLIRFAAFDAFCWPSTHCILVVSEPDRQRCLRDRPGRNVLLVPNGVDCAAIRPGAFRDKGPPILLFTGDMGFEPNVQAGLCLANLILPKVRQMYPDAELHLVGRNPDPRISSLKRTGINVTGEVPAMTPYLHAATVFVAPIVAGAGTRTKLLEAMAAGLPIVTTRVGIEGIEATDGREVVIAASPEEMQAAILRLLADPVGRRRLGAEARHVAEERYDWSRCLAPLEALYAELLPSKASRC